MYSIFFLIPLAAPNTFLYLFCHFPSIWHTSCCWDVRGNLQIQYIHQTLKWLYGAVTMWSVWLHLTESLDVPTSLQEFKAPQAFQDGKERLQMWRKGGGRGRGLGGSQEAEIKQASGQRDTRIQHGWMHSDITGLWLKAQLHVKKMRQKGVKLPANSLLSDVTRVFRVWWNSQMCRVF